MRASNSNPLPAIGFLTVKALPDQGLVGGYLVLNSAARPLEFHCTAPVKPNRAQEILYGPTLRPYLYGEQIGQTLLARAKTKPLLAITDIREVLEARRFTSLPVVLVVPATSDQPIASGPTNSVPGTEHSSPTRHRWSSHQAELVEFSLGQERVAVAQPYQSDQATVAEHWRTHMQGMDLLEPFGRIHEAIQEAQQKPLT